MDVKIINVALCGGGVVGGGVCEIINSKNSDLLRNGIVFNITKDKPSGKISHPISVLGRVPLTILKLKFLSFRSNETIDLV